MKSFEKDQQVYENTSLFKKDSSDEKNVSNIKQQLYANGSLSRIDSIKAKIDFSNDFLLSERIINQMSKNHKECSFV